MSARRRGEGAHGSRSALARFVPLVAALLLGGLVGWAMASATNEPDPAEAETIRMQAGVPVGFPNTPSGAASAVAAYERSFASPSILRPGVLRRRIETVAMPGYAATMLATNSPGERRIAAGPIGQGLANGTQTLYAAVPIGYRIESFTPQRARVMTWGFTLLGNASSVEPAAYFGLTRTELRWFKGQWRIAKTRGGFGPTPKLATRPGPLGGYGVLGVARQLRSYEFSP